MRRAAAATLSTWIPEHGPDLRLFALQLLLVSWLQASARASRAWSCNKVGPCCLKGHALGLIVIIITK